MKKRDELREEAVLLSLLREDAVTAKQQVSVGLDWEELLVLAVRHSLAPYLGSLYSATRVNSLPRSEIAGLIPQSVAKRFDTALRDTGYHNLHLLASLRPFLGNLREHRIVPIILKGAALLGRIYSDHGARLLSDLDILVPEERAVEALGLARAAGLIEVECDQHSDRRFGFRTRGPLQAKLEIHWDLSQRFRFQADLPDVWSRSIPFELEDLPARRLAPTDEFLYLR